MHQETFVGRAAGARLMICKVKRVFLREKTSVRWLNFSSEPPSKIILSLANQEFVGSEESTQYRSTWSCKVYLWRPRNQWYRRDALPVASASSYTLCEAFCTMECIREGLRLKSYQQTKLSSIPAMKISSNAILNAGYGRRGMREDSSGETAFLNKFLNPIKPFIRLSKQCILPLPSMQVLLKIWTTVMK